MRNMSLRSRHVNWNSTRNSSSLSVFPNESADAIASEKRFGEMLCLERKRAERSRRPFLLALVDLQKALKNDSTDQLIHKVWSSLCSASRDSDIRGWYVQGAVLGIIFVEIESGGPSSVSEIIRSRVTSALLKNLKREVVDLIGITMVLQPDSAANWQKWSGLYRDLQEEESGKRISRAVKRGLDVVGSATTLFVLLPLMSVIALLIKLSSRGPVFFRQPRVGHRGIPFTMLKFRTMRDSNDGNLHRQFVQRFIAGKTNIPEPAPVYKIENDPRVTRIGKLLRKTSLDELPQFWNVLKGEMSLVGPRPPIPYEVECYDIWHQRRILEAKPGITGLWQVTGRSRTTFNDMVRLDLRYAKSWSIWLDVKILFQTPRAIISGDGAY